MSSHFSITEARTKFPALAGKQVYLDNAGGSQVLKSVADSIHKYLLENNVQLGASYKTGQISTESFDTGYEAAAKYINAQRNEIVIGSSTTQLFRNLSYSLEFQAGDEIILSKLDHEANICSWLDLAKRQSLKVKWWASETEPYRLEAAQLEGLLSERTRLVTCTHVSNILGGIHDIKSIAKKVHSIPGAKLCVDGVAYCPHRPLDVKELEVDFYSFSFYKVYGPHIAMLYSSSAALPSVRSLGHFFNKHESLSEKLWLAGSCYELVQSIPKLVEYFGSDPSQAWSSIAAHEQELSTILLDFLVSHPKIKVFGEKTADSKLRVPTISFKVEGISSRALVEDAESRSNLGFRWGHFYSKRLVSEILGLDDEGVVRVSAVHYNTTDEIRQVVDVLKSIID